MLMMGIDDNNIGEVNTTKKLGQYHCDKACRRLIPKLSHYRRTPFSKSRRSCSFWSDYRKSG
jgi:hypothetical protein